MRRLLSRHGSYVVLRRRRQEVCDRPLCSRLAHAQRSRIGASHWYLIGPTIISPYYTKSTMGSSRLFSALASIEKADGVAAQRRLRSRTVSLQRSKVAATQTELHNVLLELRILTQRCLTEEECLHDSDHANDVTNNDADNNAVVMEEVDTLLRNLLASRKELMGKMISGETISNDTDDDDEILQNEYYTTLRDNIWKPTLDKLHSNLTSRSGGTSAAASEFKGGIVGTTFWEQVQSTVKHEQSRLPKTLNHDDDDDDDGGGKQQRPKFDDSKLYQRMLTDFVSTRSSSSTTSSKGGGCGVSDPAREAAERLGRALRKRSGADVDISSLWGEDDETSSKRKKTETITTAVDRRASKGRKIRYAVHPKLLNFAFPIARPIPTIVENVWFNSLFGGVGKSR